MIDFGYSKSSLEEAKTHAIREQKSATVRK